MACFITFIELTLTANSIFGVYTLRTTGQLIPFIIGITSLAAAMRELALRHVRKVLASPTVLKCLAFCICYLYIHSNTPITPWCL